MKQELFLNLKNILVNYFELPESLIVYDTDLYDELEMDSIDTIDLMVKLREMTDLDIEPETFKQIRTVGDVVDQLHKMMEA